MYVCVYIYIYERRKKHIYKVYTSVHTQFSMGHALPEERGSRLTGCTSSAIAANGDAREPVLSVPYRAQRLVVWLLQ